MREALCPAGASPLKVHKGAAKALGFYLVHNLHSGSDERGEELFVREALCRVSGKPPEGAP